MSTLKATLLRAGMIIKHEGDLHMVYNVDHRTQGNKPAPKILSKKWWWTRSNSNTSTATATAITS